MNGAARDRLKTIATVNGAGLRVQPWVKAEPKALWEWDSRLSRGRGGYRLTTAGAEQTGQRAGTVVGFQKMVRYRDEFVARQGERTAELAQRLFDKQVTIQEWTLEMRQLIKETYIGQYVLASGGRNKLGPADWGRVGAQVRSQYAYLQGFAQDIVNGRYNSAAAIAARAGLYINSSTQMFERGNAARHGLTLPAYPGDGSSVCVTNCRCYWDIEEMGEEWHCTWVRTAEESCKTCIERAETWAPYVVPK